MASKYGVAFTKSRTLHVVAWLVSVRKALQDLFNSNKRGCAWTRNKSK